MPPFDNSGPDLGPARVDAERVLLTRYYAGECAPHEIARAEALLARRPVDRTIVDVLREGGPGTGRPTPAEAEAAFSELAMQLRLPMPAPSQRTRRSHVVIDRGWWLASGRVAIAAVVVLAFAVGLYDVRRQGLVSRTSMRTADATWDYVTASGQREVITLADGSQVTLAPESRLRIGAHFGAHERRVDLEGQGVFDVAHDVRHPFAVVARGVITQDVGTRFDVRAYGGDPAGVRVVVERGAVRIMASSVGVQGAIQLGVTPPGVMLVAHTLATVDTSGVARVMANVDPAPFLAWTEGRLDFRAVPTREALATLGRWYGLDFRLSDPALGDEPFTGSFRDDPEARVVRALALLLHASAKQHGQVVMYTRHPNHSNDSGQARSER